MTIARRAIIAATVVWLLTVPLMTLADTDDPFLQNPLYECKDFLCLVQRLIQFFLGGVAIIGTLTFIYGGYLFLASAGNPDMINKGKTVLTWSVVGIMTILGSWVLIQFVIRTLMKST